jgi:phospholipase C
MSSCGKALMPFVIISVITWFGCVGLVSGVDQVTVTTAGGGTGVVTSTPNGINCSGLGGGATSGTCQLTFRNSPTLTLTATVGQGFTFGGWTGCKSPSGTTCIVSGAATVTATFTASLQSINHIIFIAQENRSFDSYFGAMRAYWAQSGIADQSFDGLPQFNPPANPAAAPSNPGCNPATSTTLDCHVNPATGDVGPPVTSFHLKTMCLENPSPSWNESHRDWDASDPVAPPPPTLDGFVASAANDARQIVPAMNDVNGLRAMGYYNGGDLNYYYSLASNFATSDRWFSPVLTRTPPNREYLIGGTSHGYVYPIGTNPNNQTLIPTPPIYQILDQHSPPITWKIYVNPVGTSCSATSNGTCLFKYSYVQNFSYVQTIINQEPQNIAPISQIFTDIQNNTLPQVVQIEPASNAGLDEHPADSDVNPPCCSVQAGAAYVSKIINAVMSSSSWSSTIFVFTFDEPGGFYDHVAPQPAVSPDGIPPVDLIPGDTCTSAVGPNCDFVFTGYRVPLIVISPYSKKNYVSHAANADGSGVDETAILKLIETRFGLSPLTKRDADQLDMSQEFLDFTNVQWRTPPSTLPAQNVSGPCYLNSLP